MKILIAGGTGFIGRELLRKLLRERHDLIVLSRSAHVTFGVENFFVETVWWDGKSVNLSKINLEGIDIIINLSGESIAGKRWTNKRKKEIIKSRIEPVKALVELTSKLEKKPKMFICMSAVGYYGDVPFGEVDESTPKGRGFLSDVCELWESEAQKIEAYGVELAICRLGVVLGKRGGMIKKLYPVFNRNLGALFGSGGQGFSWIHYEDVVNAINFIVKNKLTGKINITSPNPVSMKEFSNAFAAVLGKKCFLKIPEFPLKIALGEMSETILEGQRAVPKILISHNFSFKYDKIYKALLAVKNE